MKKITLSNGLRIIYKQKKSNIFVINVSVLVGSNNESKKILGISHLLEHMLFEGTKNRSSIEISKEIEKYGGELNAFTSSDKTNYYIKIHQKYAEKAVEILADMIINPLFNEKSLEKEKNVVLEEINAVNDNPKSYQWVLLQKKLYSGQLSNPIYGTKETVVSIKKEDLEKYHSDYYVPNNMIITIIGNVSNYKEMILKHFKIINKNKKIVVPKVIHEKKSKKVYVEKRKNLNQVYLVIGYKTPRRNSKESYVLDVISALLAKGQSGKLFDEIRTKKGLTYDLGIYHDPGSYYGIFAFYSSASKDKIKEIEKIYFKELEKLKNVNDKDLEEAKSYIEGNMALRLEGSHEEATMISFFEECGNFKEINNYVKNIKKVTKKQVRDTIIKYLGKNYTKIILK